MSKKNKKSYKKNIKKQAIICSITVLLIVILNVFVFKNNLITPKIDELTTSYLSFYNQNTTDMLKINNIEKMSDKKGQSKYNKKSISFNISTDKNLEYETVLYDIQNNIPKEYIMVLINVNNEKIVKNLASFDRNEDGSRVLYRGKTQKDNIKIKMWVSDNYKDNVNDTSFEIQIKKR